MSDLIDGDELLKWMNETQWHTSKMDAVRAKIKSMPTVERKGEWIWSPRDTDGTVSGCCSNCSFSHLFMGGHTAQYNYCPNCGARMKGADDDD